MYIGIFFLSVLVAAVSQVLLKKSAMKQYAHKWAEYLNPYVIIGYGLLFLRGYQPGQCESGPADFRGQV